MEWRAASFVSKYEYGPQLSFDLLAQWLLANVEQEFINVAKSEVICQSRSVLYPMQSLVCDCVSNETGPTCYFESTQDKEVLMGLSSVCNGEESFIKVHALFIFFFSVFNWHLRSDFNSL